MKAIAMTKTTRLHEWIPMIPKEVPEEVEASDEALFLQVTSTRISAEQETRITAPEKRFARQHYILAVHWHPEFVPMPLIRRRIDHSFPNRELDLIIPTQHNVLTEYGPYAGVEIDCYSKAFNQKVQLLLHFKKERLEKADLLRSMLAHTFQYRSSQLFDFIHTLTRPVVGRIESAARQTGADADLIRFVTIYVKKIEHLLEQHATAIPPEMIKNKLLRNFFDGLRERYSEGLIDRVQTFLKAVKVIVKADFSLQYFYHTSEVIEEARSLGAGIVIPHPEQFWPILLADYDVDGYEVWNPQSRRYTEFLISVIDRKNRKLGAGRKKLLVFMGDDTHMGEKLRDPEVQDPEKAGREIGYQPAWDDFSIRKMLIRTSSSRRQVIDDYRERLEV